MRTSPPKADPVKSAGEVLTKIDRPWPGTRPDHAKLEADGPLKLLFFLECFF
jgi:hypothetical protein